MSDPAPLEPAPTAVAWLRHEGAPPPPARCRRLALEPLDLTPSPGEAAELARLLDALAGSCRAGVVDLGDAALDEAVAAAAGLPVVVAARAAAVHDLAGFLADPAVEGADLATLTVALPAGRPLLRALVLEAGVAPERLTAEDGAADAGDDEPAFAGDDAPADDDEPASVPDDVPADDAPADDDAPAEADVDGSPGDDAPAPADDDVSASDAEPADSGDVVQLVAGDATDRGLVALLVRLAADGLDQGPATDVALARALVAAADAGSTHDADLAAAMGRAACEAAGRGQDPAAADYPEALAGLLAPLRAALRAPLAAARAAPCRVVFPDGESPDAIAAANRLVAAGTAAPILLGDLFRLESKAREAGISLKGVRVLNPRRDKWREPYATALLADRGRALGLDREAAERLAEEPGVFAALTCLQGEADAVVARAPRAGGAAGPLGAGLALLGQDEIAGAAGCTVTTRGGEVRVWVDPRAAETSSEAIAAAARDGAALARLLLGRAPRVAVLGPATYGGGDGPRGDLLLERLSRAVEVARADDPDLTVDGPLELDVALDPTLQEAYGPTATLGGPADVLVAPEPTVARACVDLVRLLPDADALGPLLIGLRVPVCLTSQEGPEPLTLAAALASALHQARSRAATESALQTTLTDALQRAVRARTPRPPATRIEGAAQGAP